MQVDGRHVVIDLEHRELLKLRLQEPACLICLDGVLWVTRHLDEHDRVLTPGLALGAPADNDIVVQALGASRLSLRPLPEPASTAARGAAPIIL
jgi:hypothetical protein